MIDKAQLTAFVAQARNAPRLTGMYEEFGRLAAGTSGRPIKTVTLDASLLRSDAPSLEYAKIRQRHACTFNQHFVASLPYVLEEQCRLGAGLLKYGQFVTENENRPMALYTLGDGSGVTSRTLAEMSQGNIHTLSCSPNPENKAAFQALNVSPNAHFYLGPFFDVTKTSLAELGLEEFVGGFDVIVEDTTFQMYGKERLEPLLLAKDNLKSDGIFILIEKLMNEDSAIFVDREVAKDSEFKARYFDATDIVKKQTMILSTLDQQLVTLTELAKTLKELFKFAVVTWNSGNFYTVAASNSLENLQQLVGSLIPAAITPEFCHIELPLVLVGEDAKYNFRLSELS